MPRCAGSDLLLLQQHYVAHAGLGQVVSHRVADDAAADHHDCRLRRHVRCCYCRRCRRCQRASRGLPLCEASPARSTHLKTAQPGPHTRQAKLTQHGENATARAGREDGLLPAERQKPKATCPRPPRTRHTPRSRETSTSTKIDENSHLARQQTRNRGRGRCWPYPCVT
jgi:hypothetical protein